MGKITQRVICCGLRGMLPVPQRVGRGYLVCSVSLLFTGKAQVLHSILSSKDARDYDEVLFFQRYNFSEQGYRKRYNSTKLEEQESPGQLIVKIRNYYNKWVELSEVGKTFNGVEELMV